MRCKQNQHTCSCKAYQTYNKITNVLNNTHIRSQTLLEPIYWGVQPYLSSQLFSHLSETAAADLQGQDLAEIGLAGFYANENDR